MTDRVASVLDALASDSEVQRGRRDIGRTTFFARHH